MSFISLTNTNDQYANSFSLINDDGTTTDILDAASSRVSGIAPATLNTITKLSNALQNDPLIFSKKQDKIVYGETIAGSQSILSSTTAKMKNIVAGTGISFNPNTEDNITISAAYDKTTLDGKFDNKNNLLSNGTLITGSQSLLNTTTAKLKNIVCNNLTVATDDNNITITAPYDKTTLDSKFDNKQNKFLLAETLPANTSRLFDASSTKFRGINVTSPLNIVTTNYEYVTINSDTYTKQQVDSKITALINSAPELLNTLGEISSYLGNPTNTSTNLITLIGTKATSTETFTRSKIDDDYYLGGLGNKRIISLGTIANNKLIFQIQDTLGPNITDSYFNGLTLQMDTTTKKISCYIPDFLYVNNINVMSELALKMNTTDLANYASISSLSQYLKLDFNQLQIPKIILTDENVGPPITQTNSVGSRVVLYSLQKNNTAYTNIGIGVDAGSWTWFGIDGASTYPPLSLGGWRFYQSTNIVATIKSNGDFICKNINCDGLMIGATNILNELNNKISNSATQSITSNVITAKSLIISDTKAYSSNTQSTQVSATISNNGTSGVASLFVKTQNSNGIDEEVLKIHTGKNMGGSIETTSQSRLKFSTFTSDPVTTNNRASLEIESYGSREVIVVAPLSVQCDLSTFERNIMVGTLNAVNVNNITTIGGIQVGGKLRVNDLIETNYVRIIPMPSEPGLDAFAILNTNNSMIAKFYDDYHCDLGATNILGNLFCTHPIDAYRFTPTEIVQRDINPLLIKKFGNATAIEINSTAVEIQQPLKVNSSTNSSFSYGSSFGVLQPTSSLGINCYSSAQIGSNLTVLGTTNVTGDINILRSAPNGGEVAMGITNNGQSAYSSLYIQTRNQVSPKINETGQIFCGAGSMVVQTRTNGPLILKSFADDLTMTVPDSLTISNNITRDIVCASPLWCNDKLLCSNIHPSGSVGFTFKKIDNTTAVKIAGTGAIQCYENATFDKNLTVTGTSSLGTVEKILFNNNVGPPTLGTRSIGTKLVLYPSISSTALDYSIGIESNNMFFTTQSASTSGYKFYSGAGDSNIVCQINGSGDLTTKAGVNCKSLTVTSNSNSTIAGNLNVTGSLTTSSFFSNKPWVSCLITTTSVGIISLTNYGFCTLTSSNVTRIGTNNKAYSISFPEHPDGNKFIVMAIPYTLTSASWDGSAIPATDYVCTTAIGGSTSMNVWCRRPAESHNTGMVNGNFYCYTVP
jgi:hypothetical protein